MVALGGGQQGTDWGVYDRDLGLVVSKSTCSASAHCFCDPTTDINDLPVSAEQHVFGADL
jgi:hypothetical protein